ncbi:MAG: Ig-like domain-containing protein [Endomicrobiia bacterium]
MKLILLTFLVYVLSLLPLSAQTFYFYLPWDDSSSNVCDISWLNHKPAGKYGFVSAGTDGHFYAGSQRIKFLGVNFTSDACFPLKTQAEQVAKRLAKFGINIARLHFLDNPWGYSIFGYAGTYTTTRSFNQEALDRLDYFISKLKENGIYVNINLVVGRNFMPGDGLPSSINQLDWKQKQVPAMFYEPMIDLQKEYAYNLLTRLNPYTSTYYNNEPAVAMVEIINEHGLIQGWLDRTIDILPQEFSENLRQKWNNWLVNKYQTHSNLVSSGWALSEPLGQEMLKNADFSQGFTYWNREQQSVARASFTIVNEGPNGERAVKIKIENTSSTSWHVQFNQPGLVVFSTRPYTLSFYAKADRNTSINVQIGQAHEPWQILGFDRVINLTTYYQLFTFELTVSSGDTNARVNFSNMCKELATYWLSNISFRPGGNVGLLAGENLDNGTVGIIKYQERNLRTQKAQRDWIEFLHQLEENFWLTMYDYLKNTVGIKCAITGTTVGLTSVPNIMSKLDFVDTHSYWHHPVFPGTAWNMNNWYVTNATLVKDLDGGTISEMAMRRVYGKPFTVTEYNHPAPNTFSAECFIFLAAYAAFHDWDGIFGYTYSHSTSFDTKRITGFFDLHQHPVQFASFIPAALIYRRGDISSSNGNYVVVNVTKQDEINQALTTWAWRLIHANDLGLNRRTAMLYKTAMIVEGGPQPQNYLTPSQVQLPTNNYYVSDTNELKWDTSNGVFIGDASKVKFLVGYLQNQEYTLSDNIVIRNVNSIQNKWAVITLNSIDGKTFSELNSTTTTGQILITALGACGNPGMNWMVYPNTPISFPPPVNQNITVGNQWGGSTSFVEGISCDIVLPYLASRVKVYALDNTGARKTVVPITVENNKAKFTISHIYQTLWYEVEVSTTETTQIVDNPPNLTIVSPGDNSIVFSTVAIRASASDDFGVSKVEFYIDNLLVYTDNLSPYEFIWHTTSTTNGLHYIKAIAYDTLNQSTTAQITVIVNNPYYPLYIQVNPQNSGSVTRYPNKQVYLKGEQVQLYATASSGYKFLNWSGDIQTSSNPVVLIMDSTKTVIANFEVISSTSPLEDNLPEIWINLINGQTVSGTIELKIVVSDDYGITSLSVYKNNSLVISLTTSTLVSNVNYIWDTILDTNGIYEIKIEAKDTNSQVSVKTVALVVNNVAGNLTPKVTLPALTQGSVISTVVEVVPVIENDDEIIKVEYYLDDNLIYTSTQSPFSFTIDPKNYTSKNYTFVVLAYDASNQVGSYSVNITLSYSQPEPTGLKLKYFLSLNEDDKNEVIEFKSDKEIEEIKIYDIRGRLLKQIKENFVWNGKDNNANKLKPGFYIYRCKFKDGTLQTGSILVVK